jgi:UDP-3-O-[3-hydroxymyristoyl] glucosamine N-acyltransferase
MKLRELAQMLDAALDGPGEVDIAAVAGLHEARTGDITFVADRAHLADLGRCLASAVIIPADAPPVALPALRVRNPRLSFARTLGMFHGKPYRPGGVSERAVIGRDAVIGGDATIHPFVVVGHGAKIGSRVTLHPGVTIGPGSSVGDDCILYPQVAVYTGVTIGDRVIIHAGTVIGSDGFGFVTDGGKHHKIPQVGGVIIEDDVEIGANSTIDRSTLGNTIIKRGTKIDNQVQVAHNVTIGEHCLLAAQAGVAGSTKLGNYVVMGGQVGVGDHLSVGDRVMIGGGSGVKQDVEAGQIVSGYYSMPIREWLKVQALLPKLPEMKKQIAGLQRQLRELLEDRPSEEENRP